MERRRGPRVRRERLLEVYERYQRAGTLASVGREMGITKERVRQLLRRGAQDGLYPYPVPREEDRRAYWLARYEQVRQALGRHPSATELQNHPSWRSVYLSIVRYWGGLQAFRRAKGIHEPQAHWAQRGQAYWLTRYEQVRRELGRHPSALELQQNAAWKGIYASLRRHWGGIRAFRRARGIAWCRRRPQGWRKQAAAMSG